MHDVDGTREWAEPELEGMETGDFEMEDAFETSDVQSEAPFNEIEEMDLAAQFLEIADESEMDQFLGNLLKKATRSAGRFLRTPAGRALGGMLRNVARKALPVVGGSIGTVIGGPFGGAIGGKLASGAGRLFGLELEGLSQEDQEFEVARRFVKFAGTAARKAAASSASAVPSQDAVRKAVYAAAQTYAPGLVTGTPLNLGGRGLTGRSGRWIRRGSKIIVLGI